MRTAIVALLALTAGAFALLASDVFDWRREVPGAPADGDTEARLSAVEARVEELARALDRLTAQLARAPGEARVALPSNAPAPTGPAGPERLDPRGDAWDPHWYLVQYERSFDGGGSGSEYFRLAVDAYAPELLAAITALVRDASLPTALRANLAAMLGTPRFAGNQHVIGVLVATLRDGCPPEIATVALQGLAVVGDENAAVMLERLLWNLDGVELQQRGLGVIVQLAGSNANAALQRLFAASSSTEQKALVLAALSTAEPGAALDVFRQASTDASVELRLHAARALGRFRGAAFPAFAAQWLGYETDDRVRRQLGEAQERMSQVPAYSAEKATGAPDAEPGQDHPNAWASRSPQMGDQWLELGYVPRRASAVRIHEVNVAGEVAEIHLIDERGDRHRVFTGADPTTRPGVFEVAFPPTAYRVRGVRLVLDTNRKPGWGEIDAVELLGPDGSGWAVSAVASSSYGQ